MTDSLSVEIVRSPNGEEVDSLSRQLAHDRIASLLAAADPTLWGAEAEPEASIRLSWTTLHETSRPLLAEIDSLRASLHADGIDRVVLAGMGGSSLAPEVICATDDVPLVVLDTTDAGQVADALAGDLHRTVLVVSSKSGGTVETDSHRRIFTEAFTAAGLNPAAHMVAVTDPGSPLETLATEAGYRKVFLADPHVGGRYSALTAFGLVPAGLAGADISRLLDDAAAVAPALAADDADNPAIQLAAVLGVAHAGGAEKVVLATTGTTAEGSPPGFGDWAEQLIAESTGKHHTGLLPVAVESPEAPGFADAGDDATTVAIGRASEFAAVATAGSLGALFLLWETATALVGRVIGINPFDQPDVEAAKAAARKLLDGPADGAPAAAPTQVDGPIEIYAEGGWLTAGAGTVAEVLRAFIAAIPSHGYLSVQAYLDRLDDASTTLLRPELARRAGVQTTFGWGPRFLHSTGQYHKGGHQNGAFLQVTGAVAEDIAVPERPYTLGGLQHAQAIGDGQVLVEHGRPLLRLHLIDRVAGLAHLIKSVQEVS